MLSVPAQEVVDAMLEIELELNAGEDVGDDEAPTPDLDDLNDLESLLDESVTLAKAKRDKALGRKLSGKQLVTLTANEIAQHELVWEGVAVIAHFKETLCACGEVTRVFDGWFLYERHRRQVGSIRLARIQGLVPTDLPQFQHVSDRTAGACACCMPVLPTARVADFPTIIELGMSEVSNLAQGELF